MLQIVPKSCFFIKILNFVEISIFLRSEFKHFVLGVHASDISFGLDGMPDESRRSSGLGQQGTNSTFLFFSKS